MASGDAATVLSRGRAKGNVPARLRLAYELFFELNATLRPRLEDVTAAPRDKVRQGQRAHPALIFWSNGTVTLASGESFASWYADSRAAGTDSRSRYTPISCSRTLTRC